MQYLFVLCLGNVRNRALLAFSWNGPVCDRLGVSVSEGVSSKPLSVVNQVLDSPLSLRSLDLALSMIRCSSDTSRQSFRAAGVL